MNEYNNQSGPREGPTGSDFITQYSSGETPFPKIKPVKETRPRQNQKVWKNWPVKSTGVIDFTIETKIHLV